MHTCKTWYHKNIFYWSSIIMCSNFLSLQKRFYWESKRGFALRFTNHIAKLFLSILDSCTHTCKIYLVLVGVWYCDGSSTIYCCFEKTGIDSRRLGYFHLSSVSIVLISQFPAATADRKSMRKSLARPTL